ncbi:MAG TPA: hypothetical protein VG501_06410 [Rhizomicrobium sp.]|nr:hypothetical protein [Rhizomicrobium sp.]
MKRCLNYCLLSSLLFLSPAAYAQTAPAAGTQDMMQNCPMKTDAAAMQKDLDAMMGDIGAMMKGTKDPAMKERLANMHERMAVMMVNMQHMGGMPRMMNGGMMSGRMMGGGMMQPNPPDAQKSKPESEHDAHHPNP